MADFIGKTNLIEGKVKKINADLTYIDSSLGVVASPGKPGAAIGDQVVLCLRPELFEVVSSEKAKGFNTFKGKIESLLFVGECYEGVVSLGDTSLTVRFDPKAVLQEGAEINLYIAPPQCQMLLK